jgi:hypothetical protein
VSDQGHRDQGTATKGHDETEAAVELIVSVGHGEYLPLAQEGLTAEVVWDPYEEDNLVHTEVEERALARYREVTGLEPNPDWDVTWQSIQRWKGEPPQIEAALASLMDKLEISPSGDDDTFDYWPSGVRLALMVAEALDAQLGGERQADVRRRIRTVLHAIGYTPDEVGLGGYLDAAPSGDGDRNEAGGPPM